MSPLPSVSSVLSNFHPPARSLRTSLSRPSSRGCAFALCSFHDGDELFALMLMSGTERAGVPLRDCPALLLEAPVVGSGQRAAGRLKVSNCEMAGSQHRFNNDLLLRVCPNLRQQARREAVLLIALLLLPLASASLLPACC